MNWILCGLPMSGKSTIGEMLAEQLNYTFIDTDRAIEREYARKEGRTLSCRKIFLESGENAFRKLEAEQILRLLDVESTMIALGGGAIQHRGNVENLQNMGRIIYLDVPVHEIWKRMLEKGIPPFLHAGDPEMALHQLAEVRRPLYEAAAHTIVHVGMRNVKEIVEEIIEEVINNGK